MEESLTAAESREGKEAGRVCRAGRPTSAQGEAPPAAAPGGASPPPPPAPRAACERPPSAGRAAGLSPPGEAGGPLGKLSA